MTTQAITKIEVPALPEKEQQENQRIERLIAQFSIIDAETYIQADDWGRELKRRIKVIDALFDPLIESAKIVKSAAEDNRKTLVLARNRMAQSLEGAEEHLNHQVSAYRREQQRKQ